MFPRICCLIISLELKSTKSTSKCDTHSLRYFPKIPKSTSQPGIATHTFEIFCLIPNLELKSTKSTTNRDIPYMRYVSQNSLPYYQSRAQVNHRMRHTLIQIFSQEYKVNKSTSNCDTYTSKSLALFSI